MKSILRRFAVLILSVGMLLLCGCEITTAQGGEVVAAFVRQFHADVSGTMDAIAATGKLTPEQTDTILNAWKAYEGGESHGVQ